MNEEILQKPCIYLRREGTQLGLKIMRVEEANPLGIEGI
jgi:hypothetical protein